MKRELNSQITYCQTETINQRAAKAHLGKTQRGNKERQGEARVRVGGRDVKAVKERVQSGVWRLIAVDLHNKRGRQAASAPLLRH